MKQNNVNEVQFSLSSLVTVSNSWISSDREDGTVASSSSPLLCGIICGVQLSSAVAATSRLDIENAELCQLFLLQVKS